VTQRVRRAKRRRRQRERLEETRAAMFELRAICHGLGITLKQGLRAVVAVPTSHSTPARLGSR
jgi:hypothetical protein